MFMKKVGFIREGELIDEFFVDGTYHDAIRMCIFQHQYREMDILKSDWRGKSCASHCFGSKKFYNKVLVKKIMVS